MCALCVLQADAAPSKACKPVPLVASTACLMSSQACPRHAANFSSSEAYPGLARAWQDRAGRGEAAQDGARQVKARQDRTRHARSVPPRSLFLANYIARLRSTCPTCVPELFALAPCFSLFALPYHLHCARALHFSLSALPYPLHERLRSRTVCACALLLPVRPSLPITLRARASLLAVCTWRLGKKNKLGW
jgi:hypothetical protein